jgi:aryl-alcohol dehydrogenase-like predicted oxidoreductase
MLLHRSPEFELGRYLDIRHLLRKYFVWSIKYWQHPTFLTLLTSSAQHQSSLAPLHQSPDHLPFSVTLIIFTIMASENVLRAQYRQLGQSGLRVSLPILGGMGFGDKRTDAWKLEEEEALPILKAAYDRGLNTWDTSNSYSNGISEEIIGKAIRKYNIPRHKLIILTKCFNPSRESNTEELLKLSREDLKGHPDYVNQFGLSRQGIFNSVNASLRRMQLDYIDLLQIHRYDPDVPIEETIKALHDLVEQGKVRYIGASSMWTYQFAMMQFCAEKYGWTKFISMQNSYSLLYREEELEMIKFCDETGVGLIPWGPLNTGRLARPAKDQTTARAIVKNEPPTAQDAAIIDRVEELASKKGCTMSQVALAWINQRVASPISSFSSVARMEEALAANQVVLTEEEEKYLEELYQPKPIKGHANWRGKLVYRK